MKQLNIKTASTAPVKEANYWETHCLTTAPEVLIALPACDEGDALVQQLQTHGYTCHCLNAWEEISQYHDAAALIVDFDWDGFAQDTHPSDQVKAFKLTHTQAACIVVSQENHFNEHLLAVRSGGDAFFPYPLDMNDIVRKVDAFSMSHCQDPYRILLIAPKQAQTDYCQLTLNQAGIETHHVTQVAEVHAELNQFKPDLILLDRHLDHCTGDELAQMIRQQDHYLHIPIVFMINQSDLAHQRHSFHGEDFLAFPLAPEKLANAVHQRCQRARDISMRMAQDSLTGLLNHHHTLEQLDTEISRAVRQGQRLCFAMLDIDHFKHINDTYGHPVGDKVIYRLAQILKQRLRRTDIVGRYGGEEFAIILPQTMKQDALKVLNDIRDLFAQGYALDATHTIEVSFSCGLTEFLPDTDAPDGKVICQKADTALYDAKTNGKNRIIVK